MPSLQMVGIMVGASVGGGGGSVAVESVAFSAAAGLSAVTMSGGCIEAVSLAVDPVNQGGINLQSLESSIDDKLHYI